MSKLEEARSLMALKRFSDAAKEYMGALNEYPLNKEIWGEYLGACRAKEGVSNYGVSAVVSGRAISSSLDEVLAESRVGIYKEPYNLDHLWKLGVKCGEIAKLESGEVDENFMGLSIFAFKDIFENGFFANGKLAAAGNLAAYGLVRNYCLLEMYEEAKPFLKSVENNKKLPEDLPTLDELESLITIKKYEKAGGFVEVASSESKELAEPLKIKRDNRIEELEKELVGIGKGDEGISVVMELCEAYSNRREYGKAMRALENGENLNPGNYQIAKRTAEVSIDLSNMGIDELVRKGGGEQEIDAKKLEKWDKLISMYEGLVAMQPNELELHLVLGEGLFSKGVASENRDMLIEAAVHLQKDYVEASHVKKSSVLLGRTFLALGFSRAASVYFEKFIKGLTHEDGVRSEDLDDYLDACFNLSLAREQSGDLERAHEVMVSVVEKRIMFEGALEKLGELEVRLGEQEISN